MKKTVLGLMAALTLGATAAQADYYPGYKFDSQFDHCVAAMKPALDNSVILATLHCVSNFSKYDGTW